MKSSHMLVCALLLAVGVVLVASGVGAVAFLPLVMCGLMMGAMMWMMTRAGRNDRSSLRAARTRHEHGP